jgi:putative component of toxin-antitoxin plasmid stabilization module
MSEPRVIIVQLGLKLGVTAENDVVILLCGGDKDSQDRDIEKAKEYWQVYQEEQNEQETEKP